MAKIKNIFGFVLGGILVAIAIVVGIDQYQKFRAISARTHMVRQMKVLGQDIRQRSGKQTYQSLRTPSLRNFSFQDVFFDSTDEVANYNITNRSDKIITVTGISRYRYKGKPVEIIADVMVDGDVIFQNN